jgi:Ca-activated chloride channel family protein
MTEQLSYDPYSILGVSNNASNEDLKRAYRHLVQRLHPDKNPDSAAAATQFLEVQQSYDILSDPVHRRTYDSSPIQSSSEDSYFTLRVTPSKRSMIVMPESQVIYLLAEIFPAPQAEEVEHVIESRLNLTLVLDQSNSMNGARLEKVKYAAQQIIDKLDRDDIISVITFNDRATVLIPATPVENKAALKTRIAMMTASGGTEIYQGLSAGLEQIRKYYGPKLVNQMIMLTDGHTFGDQARCIELAEEAATQGIGLNAMGLGSDWNDEFLDDLATKTGGTSFYVKSPSMVADFMQNQVQQMTNAFAERMKLSVASDPDVQLELAFKLAPNPQPLESNVSSIPLGSLQAKRPISVLLQFQMPPSQNAGFRTVARIIASGDILQNQRQAYRAVSDISLEVSETPATEEPPTVILDALSKLTLYRLQERAQEALEDGDVVEATRRLENLATRLLEMGEDNLAQQTLAEARRVAHTNVLSEKGKKTLKYQTRSLLLGSGLSGALSSLLGTEEQQ